MATAHSSTARMRWRTLWAVCTFTCQMGVRTASTSVLATSETGRLPMRGNTTGHGKAAWSRRRRHRAGANDADLAKSAQLDTELRYTAGAEDASPYARPAGIKSWSMTRRTIPAMKE